MRALLRSAAIGLLGLLPAVPLAAQENCVTPGEKWTIESFSADYVVRPNGSIGVVERIEVDFGDARKHGIYREIPERSRLFRLRPEVDAREKYDIEVGQVTAPDGEEYPTKVSTSGGWVRIRIGDPDFCVTGRRTYVVHYEISDGVSRLEGWDEVYWQVTGTGWPVSIREARARVILPPERAHAFADSAPWDASCYAGPPASTSDERCLARVVEPGSYVFTTTGPLEQGEGLTFAATFPTGAVPGPSPAERLWRAFLFFGPLAIPGLALGIMFGVWWDRGRDPAGGSVVPEWEPPEGIRPGPAGTLVDQRADMDDVIATILDLAVRGWIRIREVPPEVLPGVDEDSLLGRTLGALGMRRTDWEFVRLREDEEALERFEVRTLEGIFDGHETRRLSDLKEEFYEDVPDIEERLYHDLVKRGLFPDSPQKTRRRWVVAGVAVLVLGGGLGFLGAQAVSWLLVPAMILSGIVVLVFAFYMPATTAKGARQLRHVKGLEEYIRRAEKEELEFRNAPEKSPELFETLLPYAVALDVSDVWVEQFEGILQRPPDWYSGRTTGWSVHSFERDLSGFRAAAASTLASSPGGSGGSGSFGGGSVGGGGGGGGGGSW